jgi:hypothetical protein
MHYARGLQRLYQGAGKIGRAAYVVYEVHRAASGRGRSAAAYLFVLRQIHISTMDLFNFMRLILKNRSIQAYAYVGL